VWQRHQRGPPGGDAGYALLHRTRLKTLLHLVGRFVGSLRPGGPGAPDDAWAVGWLLPGEVALWRRMSGADRRHAVGVARRTVAELGLEAEPVEAGARAARCGAAGAGSTYLATRPIVAAALLHDVGKIESSFGPWRRAIATVLGFLGGRSRAEAWRHGGPPLDRVGRYLCHDAIGADLLRSAASDPLTVAWAREHHLPAERWSMPPAVGAALKLADDD
jgi:hypothetical protein